MYISKINATINVTQKILLNVLEINLFRFSVVLAFGKQL